MKSMLIAGLTLASVTTGAFAQAIVISPEEETEIRTYVTRERVAPVEVPSGFSLSLGAILPPSIELRTVPKHEKYRVVVVEGRTVLVDPQTRKVVRIIER